MLLCAVLLGVAGCGSARQDADEPEGTYRLEVADASFPAKQGIAEQSTMRIAVRNAGDSDAPDVAVTVETKGSQPGGAGLTARPTPAAPPDAVMPL